MSNSHLSIEFRLSRLIFFFLLIHRRIPRDLFKLEEIEFPEGNPLWKHLVPVYLSHLDALLLLLSICPRRLSPALFKTGNITLPIYFLSDGQAIMSMQVINPIYGMTILNGSPIKEPLKRRFGGITSTKAIPWVRYSQIRSNRPY